MFGKKPSEVLTTPSYDLKGHVEHVRQLHANYPLNDQAKCDNHTIGLIKKTGVPWLELPKVVFAKDTPSGPTVPKTRTLATCRQSKRWTR